ncbi:MBL fold metallo-hydrolase RNA specificity domain-containing protein [Mesorhizobium sp. SB112]|uniref:MBL fold metallo-hydrolase RNA specificity domain-containing protein n=1 Tax=Mesorhizobium sp. SB112 TaxID=3151853 RepID=UPI003267368B
MGGRVLHHLKDFAPDARNTIILAGFQAAGTRGQWFPVNAEVAQLDMLSAHADSGELMPWLSGFKRPSRRVFILHGEPGASEALRVRTGRELGWGAVVPRQNQVFAL